MNWDQFRAQLQRLEEGFGKKYAPEMARIMFRRLYGTSLKVVDQAIENLLIEEKFLPRWNEIQGAVARTRRGSSQPPPSQRPAEFKCRVCEDSGIKLRAKRADIAKDFYCFCEAAAGMTKHDWSAPEWRATLTGFENLPSKERVSARMKALRRATKSQQFKIVDMASGEVISILEAMGGKDGG